MKLTRRRSLQSSAGVIALDTVGALAGAATALSHITFPSVGVGRAFRVAAYERTEQKSK